MDCTTLQDLDPLPGQLAPHRASRKVRRVDVHVVPGRVLLDVLDEGPIYAADASNAMIGTEHLRPPALHSFEALRQSANSVAITVSRHAAPGNWIPISGNGPMKLVLTLYDTPAASSSGIADIALPAIRKATCNG